MTPTGRIEQRDGQRVLVQSRELRAPLEDVWAAITEPERLARWIGTWTGDPATGSVTFAMTFEGQVEGDTMMIRVCEPPHRLHVSTQVGEDWWLLDLDLTHHDGVTTLTFSQAAIPPEQAGAIAAGWDYYLDRLVDVETGADPSLRDFDRDYYPATAAHYTDQV